MDEELQTRLERSGYHRMGFAAHYDRYRPRPPLVLLELLPLGWRRASAICGGPGIRYWLVYAAVG